MDFVVTHMGNDRDVLDRELQAKFLARELANASVYIIVMFKCFYCLTTNVTFTMFITPG